MTVIPRVAVIGAAGGKGQEYLEALSKRTDVKLVAGLVNKTTPKMVPDGVNIITGGNMSKLLESQSFDIAVVATPHDQHLAAVRALSQKGIRIVKEKPLAMTVEELSEYEKVSPRIFTTVQRGTHPIFQEAKKALPRIGEIISFEYIHTFNLATPTSGWRADPKIAGGGVVLDMGYHSIDQLVDFFGAPTKLTSSLGYKYEEMRKNKLEDFATLEFDYGTFQGRLLLSRHAEKKEERFLIKGTKGDIIVTPTSFELKDCSGVLIEHFTPTLSKLEINQAMFDAAFSTNPQVQIDQFARQVTVMKLIDQVNITK